MICPHYRRRIVGKRASRSISGVAAAVVALVGLSCSAGDSGVAVPSSSADATTPSSSGDERVSQDSEPVSSVTSSPTSIPADALHRAPDAITREGAMLAGVDVLNGGGVVVSGTATSVHVERGEFDMDYAVTVIDVGRTFLGPEFDEIEVYTAVPFLRMEEGRSYLLFVNPTATIPPLTSRPHSSFKTRRSWT